MRQDGGDEFGGLLQVGRCAGGSSGCVTAEKAAMYLLASDYPQARHVVDGVATAHRMLAVGSLEVALQLSREHAVGPRQRLLFRMFTVPPNCEWQAPRQK